MIVLEHTFPLWAIVLIITLALVLGLFTAWRFLQRRVINAVLVFFYVLILAGMTWCMLLPGLRNTFTQVRKPRFIVALDTSQSMALTPAPEVPSRWKVAQEALKRPWFSALAGECEVEFFPFDVELSENTPISEAESLKPKGAATRLRQALKKIAEHSAGLNVAGMLLLSDGTDTGEALDDWAGVAQPFPVYTLRLEPPGGWKQDPDVRIDSVTTSRRVTLGWKSELKVKVSGQGTRGASVAVQLYENGALLSEIPTQIPDEGGEREVTFELEHPKMGTFQYRVFVPPLSGEKNKEDNEQMLSVEVVDAKNRLLYLEGVPRWEYKYVRRMLLAERQISPIIFFTGPDGAPHGGTPVGNVTADMTPQQLAYFKIIMLGNIDAKELGPARAKNLVKFVEEGGSLILLGGAKGWSAGGLAETDLGKMLPVRAVEVKTLEGEKPYPVKLSEAARGHPAFAGDAAFWQNIPPVLSLFTGFTLSSGAETLVTADTPSGQQPVVATQRFGQGKVTAILTDSLWRWQLGPEAGKARPYERFWTQLISWLLPRQEALDSMRLEFFADRDQIFLGESLELNARFGTDDSAKPDSVEAKITLPDKREVPYRMAPQLLSLPSGKSFPGFTVSFSATQPGLYSVSGSAKFKGQTYTSEPFSFFVKPHSPETVPRPAKVEVLQAISAASGGRFFESLEDLNEHLNKIQLHTSEQKLSDYRTLWREWPSVILLMTLLAVSWGLRKSQNMP
jgi:Putative glutamine amidotransferase